MDYLPTVSRNKSCHPICSSLICIFDYVFFLALRISGSSSGNNERETSLLATEATVQLAVLQCAALCLFPPHAVFCRYVQAVNSAWHRPKADDIFGLGTETVFRRHSPGRVLWRANVMVKEIVMASEFFFLDDGPHCVVQPIAQMLCSRS